MPTINYDPPCGYNDVIGSPNMVARLIKLAIILVLFAFLPNHSLASERILVLAASSASPALTEISDVFSRETGLDIRVSAGSSGTLARQIIQGAPADIYISAAPEWIESLASEGLLNPRLTRQLLRNRIVLVGPVNSSNRSLISLSNPGATLERLGGGRLAMGDPSHVPAGRYTQQAMENLGLWPIVRERLARQTNVRAVLAFVERGEAPLGAIYATDLALSDGVQIAAIVPADKHDPVIYTVSVLLGRERPEVIRFYDSLRDPNAADVFTRHGFGIVVHDADGN